MTEGEDPSINQKEKVVPSMQDKVTVPEYRQEMSNTEIRGILTKEGSG